MQRETPIWIIKSKSKDLFFIECINYFTPLISMASVYYTPSRARAVIEEFELEEYEATKYILEYAGNLSNIKAAEMDWDW